MDRLSINIGNQNNDGLGDKIRDAFIKVNNNFDTLFNINSSGASQADVAAVSAALANEISGRHVASTALENHVNAVSAAINAVSVNTVSVANRVSAILNSNTTLGAPTYTFNSGTPSTAKTNGTIVVPGGVGVGGNIVANALYSDNYFFANGNPISTGGGGGGSVISAPIYDLAYYQNGGTAVFGTPNLSYNGNSITLSSGNVATSTSTGALVITGGAGISGDLYIGGNLNLNGQDISAAVASINQEISSISNQVSVISQTISVMNVNIGNETSARIATSAALEAHINAVSAAMPNSYSDTISAINNAISVVSAQVYSVNMALGTRIDTVSNAASVVGAAANNATSIANAASAAAANATSIANAASNAISVEIANRQSAVAAAESHINTVSNAVSIVSNAVSIVSVGVDRVSNAASVVSVGVDRVSNAVSNEIINRQSASAALESHVNTVSAAVNVVLNAVNNEISARMAVSATLETHINVVSAAVAGIGNFAGNLSIGGAFTVNTTNSLGNVTAIINGGTNGVGNIGSSTAKFNTVFANANQANYADLAENYMADQNYEPGTVVQFGIDSEIMAANTDQTTKVVGVISTRPAYLMNTGLEGPTILPVALMGRVPCKVKGPISRGDLLVATYDGRARAETHPRIGSLIGKALEDFYGDEGTIEIIVGLK